MWNSNFYLCGKALTGTVVKKKLNNLQVVFLGCHIQWSEAILKYKNKSVNTPQTFYTYHRPAKWGQIRWKAKKLFAHRPVNGMICTGLSEDGRRVIFKRTQRNLSADQIQFPQLNENNSFHICCEVKLKINLDRWFGGNELWFLINTATALEMQNGTGKYNTSL